MKIDPIYMDIVTSSSLFRHQEYDNRITKCKFVGSNGKCTKKLGTCTGYKRKSHCRKRS